jgi:hypothetical protein
MSARGASIGPIMTSNSIISPAALVAGRDKAMPAGFVAATAPVHMFALSPVLLVGMLGPIFKTVRTEHAMTDEPNGRPNDHTTARQNRLRDALRENLKRRKSQSRGRIDQTTVTPQHDACGSDPSPARPVEQDETTNSNNIIRG